MTRMELVKNSDAYKQAKKISKDEKKKRSDAFTEARKLYRYSDFDIQSYATLVSNKSGWIAQKIDSNTQQKIATRAYKASEKVLFGHAKKVRFKVPTRFKSVEGKTNKQGLCWKNNPSGISFKNAAQTQSSGSGDPPSPVGDTSRTGLSHQVVWMGLKIDPIIDQNNPVIKHGLNSPIKYIRLLWRELNGKRRWYVQLINEGQPYQKEKNYVSDGVVGLDLNISNIAYVGDEHASLLAFAEGVPKMEREISAIQRKMQRSQRVNNPDNYHPDFAARRGRKTIVKKGKAKKGKRQWNSSANYRKLANKKRELERKKTAYAKSQNRKVVNEILRHGKNMKTENVSVKGWQKQYGKAISAKSPGFVQSELARKAENAGGQFIKFSTQKTALSQTHLDGSRIKKSLSERVHHDATGVTMHRDLFSAYLARFVNEENRLSLQDAACQYSGMEPILLEAWERFKQSANQVSAPERGQTHSPLERISSKVKTTQPDKPVGLKAEG